MLTNRFGCDLNPKVLSESLGKLGGIPGPILGKPLFHELSGLLGDTRRIARSPPIQETLEASLFKAVEVASDARPGAPGVSGDGLHVVASVGEAQNLGTQAHFGFEVGRLLDLPQPNVFFVG